MFWQRRRRCTECGSRLNGLESAEDRIDDLMRSSSLSGAEPLTHVCAFCRIQLTKKPLPLGWNSRLQELAKEEIAPEQKSQASDRASAKSTETSFLNNASDGVALSNEFDEEAYEPGVGYSVGDGSLEEVDSDEEAKGRYYAGEPTDKLDIDLDVLRTSFENRKWGLVLEQLVTTSGGLKILIFLVLILYWLSSFFASG